MSSAIASPDSLLDRATQRAGLTDFGPDGWQVGFQRLIVAVDTDVRDDAETVARVEAIIESRLINRLRVEAWFAEHGAKVDAGPPVDGPLVIAGLPRTGTTALHYLLGLDPKFRYLRRWEIDDPVPPPRLGEEVSDPRRTERQGDTQHIRTIDGPNEDGPILDLAFGNPEMVLPVPSYTLWWRDADHSAVFPYHDRFLRMLHSDRPPTRWLLKYPAFMSDLPALVAQYPGARFVITHRDPAAVVPSTCSVILSARQRRVPGSWPDMTQFGRATLDYLAVMIQRGMEGRGVLGEDRFLDISQRQIGSDPVRTVEQIYQFAGLELTSEVHEAIVDWAPANQPGARGSHSNKAEDFGLDAVGIRRAFAEYLDRYESYCER
jgi:Sulfotransferase family